MNPSAASPLQDQTVVVTGGGGGIGRAIADRCAAAGANVAVGVHRVASVATTEQGLVSTGRQLMVTPCDVTDADSVMEFASKIINRFGRVDTVIANAGVAGPIAPLHTIDPGQWRQCIEADLTGAYLTFRAFIPHLITAGRGSLIAISSVTGKRPLANRTPYAAAKMGLIGLVRSLALELGPHGVRANTVCPGSVDGPRMDSVFAATAASRGITIDAARQEHTLSAALGRLVRADEVAELCVFLASDAASAITGADLNVSAGSVMC